MSGGGRTDGAGDRDVAGSRPRFPTTPMRSTLPFSHYVDPAVLSREIERVFLRHWQYVGHMGLVPEPGSIAAADTAFGSVLFTRDQEGVLRAFHNVCRHRGARLVDGCHHRSTIQCPYHAWTYGLDGSLRRAPRSEGEEGFDRGLLGLDPVAVDVWGPFVFVNPDIEASPLADALGEMPGLVASAGVDVERLRFHSRAESRLAANWKICCENYLECYHCQVAHPGLVEVLDVAEDVYRLEEDGLLSSQFSPVRVGGEATFDAGGEIGAGQFHFLFPNLILNIAPGQANLSLGPVMPDGPTRTTRFLDYFFHPETEAGWIREYLEWDDQVGEEDTALVERVQRGVASRPSSRGVLFRSERLIGHFDRLLEAALGSGNESDD